MTAVPAVVASGSRLEPEDSCLLEVVELVCTGWEYDPAPSTTLTSFNREPCELAGEPALEEPLCRKHINTRQKVKNEDWNFLHWIYCSKNELPGSSFALGAHFDSSCDSHGC